MRRAPLVLLLLIALPPGLAADEKVERESVIVLDRGRAARADQPEHERRALALLEALGQRESRPRLLIYGTRPDGRTRAGEVRRDPRETLVEAAEKEGWAFDGETDPRKAVQLALRRTPGQAPVDVFLVGPFEGDPLEESWIEAALGDWRRKAPEGSRIYPVGLTDSARARITDLAGILPGGWLVLGVGPVKVVTDPWSPFEESVPFSATVDVPLDRVPIGGGFDADPLELRMDGGTRDVESERSEEGLRFRLRRSKGQGPNAELTFGRLDAPEVLFLAESPSPVRVTWTDPKPDVRFLDERGEPARGFTAEQIEVGDARARDFWIWASRSVEGPWTWSPEAGDLPPGLDLELDPVAQEQPDRRGWRMRVSMRAAPATPLGAEGVLVGRAADHDLQVRLPYRVSVPPGRAFARLEAGGNAMPLPASLQDAPIRITVEALNRNLPGGVLVDLVVEPPELAERLTQRLQDEQGQLREAPFASRLSLAPGTSLEVRFGVVSEARPVDGRLELRWVPIEGVEGAVEGQATFRARRPSVVVADVPRFRVARGEIVGSPGIRVDLAPDGGDAAWRSRLQSVAPTVSCERPEIAWNVEAAAGGGWRVVPHPEWRGARGETFAEREEAFDLHIAWPAGDAPGEVRTFVEVAPRWGTAGWILVGLAAIAGLIGLIALSHLRPPPVVGTLLYAVAGKEGAVGRLDLAPVGRSRRAILEDTAGRLRLEGTGGELARVRATRVGGVLETSGTEGGPHRHLLVDGLTLEVGRHRLRYLSGGADETPAAFEREGAPDLLGPEYDLEGGRIHAAGRPADGTSREHGGPPEDRAEPNGAPARS